MCVRYRTFWHCCIWVLSNSKNKVFFNIWVWIAKPTIFNPLFLFLLLWSFSIVINSYSSSTYLISLRILYCFQGRFFILILNKNCSSKLFLVHSKFFYFPKLFTKLKSFLILYFERHVCKENLLIIYYLSKFLLFLQLSYLLMFLRSDIKSIF